MKIAAGIVKFGNEDYTLKSLYYLYQSLLDSEEDFIVILILGDSFRKNNESFLEKVEDIVPDDNLLIVEHDKFNLGFPASINHIFYFGFAGYGADYVFIQGNDVFIEKNYIGKMLQMASYLDLDWVGGLEVKPTFSDNKKKFSEGEIDDLYRDLLLGKVSPELKITANLEEYNVVGDSFNANLFSRRLFNTIGYIDCHFYPNGYFSDNDFARRAQLAKLNMAQLNVYYLHLWSRTIYNVSSSSFTMKDVNDFYFPIIERYYRVKWGGEPGKELLDVDSGLCTSKVAFPYCFGTYHIVDNIQNTIIKHMLSLSSGLFRDLLGG